MVPTILKQALTAIIILSLFSCRDQISLIPKTDDQVFNAYWNQGKAEISSFELSQSRYGEPHDGKAILIFVPEDFSRSKHIKLDEPQKYKSDALRVLKLNTNKQFVTGIYNYAMMSSVYMPVNHKEYPHSLKLTAGIQDWCGQTFIQANWKGNRYDFQQMSYFESDGDSKFSLAQGWLEDELWTLIRIAPNTLPVGKIKLIPSAFYLRLNHQATKVYPAVTSLKNNNGQYNYTIWYPDLNRKLEINFELTFPYRILDWKEIYGENEVTTGRLIKTIMSNYWQHNHAEDEAMRDSLNLGH